MNLLTISPADLPRIRKRNNGTFPFWKTYRVVDGHEKIKGHDNRDMPIWGAEFRSETASSPVAQIKDGLLAHPTKNHGRATPAH